jgi:hypothetical protein
LHPLVEKGAAMWRLFKAGIQTGTAAAKTVQV